MATVEMVIDSVRVSLTNYHRVVILKEKTTDRYLPIWIGPAEADAIAIKLQDVRVPRPMTHDLLQNVISALGATVNGITVCDLKNDTFYAKIHLRVDSRDLEPVDSRPSDALALAVRSKVPIYADDSVLERAGIYLDSEGKPLTATEKEGRGEVSEEELNRLSAFREVIEQLNMDDLGKGTA